MPKRRLVWKLYVTYLIVILLSTLAVGVNAVQRVETVYRRTKARELKAKARLVEGQMMAAIGEVGLGADPVELTSRVDPLCKDLGAASGTRITVILRDGRVIGDSEENPAQMDRHNDRPEIVAAYRGEVGQQVRWSATLKTDMMYVGIPLTVDQNVAAVLRTSLPLTEIAETTRSMTHGIIIGMVIVAALASLLALVMAYRLSRPLREMREGAARFARGDFSRKLPVGGTEAEEIDGLAAALNTMAEELDRRMRTMAGQRRELEAVLSSMNEGVVAVDREQRILNVNDAARRIFGISGSVDLRGRMLAEAIRNPSVQSFVARVWSTKEVAGAEVALDGPAAGRSVELYGRLLRDENDHEMGVLLMVRDVTHLRRLEGMRRDFVANVSHELKTPITSIQGFVETLREGAARDPETAERFLTIVAQQAERLGSIIDDLLSLSRIEQEAEKSQIEMAESTVLPVLAAAAADVEALAAERQIQVEVVCPQDLVARVNAPLIEQAVGNLLNNAIKYSPERSCVTVEAAPREGGVSITVRDTGCGIPAEHLPRIFERFYRVDKARSRKLGGTGLGLSIVKHIAQAHGGTVTVESAVGKGSTFTIHLPPIPS